MRKYWTVVLILLMSGKCLQSQSVLPDSVRFLLQKGLVDRNTIKHLIVTIMPLPYSQPDSAKLYADSALKLSQQLEFDRGIAYSYNVIAEYFIYKGDYSKAIFFVYQSLDYFKRTGDGEGIVQAYYQFSEIYTELGDYRKALDYKLLAKKKLNSREFSDQEDWYVAAFDFKGFHEVNLAVAYLNMQMIDSALTYGKEAYLADSRWSFIPIVLGDIYRSKKDYTNALKYYNTPTTINFPVDSIKNYLGKAIVFHQINQPDSCLIFALKAIDASRRLNYAKGVLQASELLADYYENSNPYKSLEYLKINNTVKDGLFNKGKINQINSIVFGDELRKLDAIAAEKAARNRFKIWSLFGIVTTLLITGLLLWRNNFQKKKANSLLQQQKRKVEDTLAELKLTQAQLIQSEKMASLGQLTAGIAHEIQNPLNFVNNFSELSEELIQEAEVLRQEAGEHSPELADLLEAIKENLVKINHHGKRADAIVKGMLEHSRSGSGNTEPTDINALTDEYFRLAYHGMRGKDQKFQATIKTDFDQTVGKIKIIPQDIGRVLLNLYNNAFYAVQEKQKTNNSRHSVHGVSTTATPQYQPKVTVRTAKKDNHVEITVRDNGIGIPEEIQDQIFQPFFTTKPTGQGTGLGLSLSYDIVKAHGGEIKVISRPEEGTTIVVTIPVTS